MNILTKTHNHLKALAVAAISNAGSGHTGSSLGASAIMLALFKQMNFDPTDAHFINRDRFVLSSGHLAPLYYSALSMFGYDVSMEDLKNLRKIGSKTPGHPEFSVTDGVEATTGALGQGVANAVGMAIASNKLEERFNSVGFEIIDNYVYCLAGDGDLMEGVAMEACSLAGSLALKRLILLYDCNEVTIDGNLTLTNREDIALKFIAMGWKVIRVKKGDTPKACERAIARAKKAKGPVIVIFNTTIGIGTDKEGTSGAHGQILSEKELQVLLAKLGVKDPFSLPEDVRAFCMETALKGKKKHEKWEQNLAIYSSTNPELYRQFLQYFDTKKFDIKKLVSSAYKLEGESMRRVNQMVLSELADKVHCVLGGSADLTASTMAYIDSSPNFLAGNKLGRNIHFGVREHSMAAIANGIALYEDFIPFVSTFLAFSNYMLPAVRLSAIMGLKVFYFFTHDSLLIGEDGVTHQPIEQLGQLRQILGLNVFRPCDSVELLAAYEHGINGDKPTALVLSKQQIPPIDGVDFEGACKGGYIIKAARRNADVVIMASGSEVALAQEVASMIGNRCEVSVVSMPCISLFDSQKTAYKQKVLQPNALLHVAIEASDDPSWYKYLDYKDLCYQIDRYYSSGKGEELYKLAHFNAKDIASDILKALSTKS